MWTEEPGRSCQELDTTEWMTLSLSASWNWLLIFQERRLIDNRQLVSLVTQSCPTLCDPVDCSTPGLPVHHQLSKFTQTHVHWVGHAISSSVIPFSFRLQYFPASGCFQMSQLFTSGGQSIGVSASASVLPANTQDWSPLGWTGWVSLYTT